MTPLRETARETARRKVRDKRGNESATGSIGDTQAPIDTEKPRANLTSGITLAMDLALSIFKQLNLLIKLVEREGLEPSAWPWRFSNLLIPRES